MINSRKLEDLHPKVRKMAEAHLKACDDAGIDVLVTSTYRDIESQNALYAQGRTKPGKKVTNAKGGQSFHNYRIAYDIVPLRNGKPVWSTSGVDGKIWQLAGNLGKAQGLEWAGDWKTFKEYPHFQFTDGHSLSYFQNGGQL